ncbi:MAG: GIY-YIG nuclease family protein [Anaerolineales bacterium]|nr:GIY-YIG nuclease family protein [Anaerolineales bacterium]MCW5854509.1 GIY-YIG nuclease family protein [Anaerolineales bacterium]
MVKAYVYILGNNGGMLYVGVTNDLERRVYEHKTKAIPGYTSKFSINQLWYFEEFGHILDAITAEKRIKGWLRSKKLALVRQHNPKFADLSADWYDLSSASE